MTPLQRQRKKEQLAAARKVRNQLRIQKRKEKRDLKAAPKNKMAIWADIVGENYGERCAVCGCGQVEKKNKDGTPKLSKAGKPIISYLHKHHLLPRERYPEFKFEPINGIALCPTHHKFGKYSAHRNPIWFTLWLRDKFPEVYLWCKRHMGRDPAESS